jgi:uncharacterized protein with GYD domain
VAGYVSLFKYNEKGMSNMKSLPDQIAQAKQVYQKLGVRLIGVWLTMGEYDGVAIFDAPDDHAMAAVLLTMGGQGIGSSETMRAFSEDEIGQIVKRAS